MAALKPTSWARLRREIIDHLISDGEFDLGRQEGTRRRCIRTKTVHGLTRNSGCFIRPESDQQIVGSSSIRHQQWGTWVNCCMNQFPSGSYVAGSDYFESYFVSNAIFSIFIGRVGYRNVTCKISCDHAQQPFRELKITLDK